jgi:hypothetical protein
MCLRRSASAAATALALCAACGPKAPPASSPAPAEAPTATGVATTRRPRPRADLITAEQARASGQTTAYAVIERLHPAWLHERRTLNARDATEVGVIYNDRRMGGSAALREIRVENIISMQFFDGVMAKSRWGAGYDLGVIVVTGQ